MSDCIGSGVKKSVLDDCWVIAHRDTHISGLDRVETQTTIHPDEAKDIVRDLIARGAPVDDIRVYKPGSATPDMDWLKYSRLEYKVIITIPGPGPIFHPHELAKLVGDYVPDCAEVVVNEGNFYTLNSMEEESARACSYKDKEDVVRHMLRIAEKKVTDRGYSVAPELQYALANCAEVSLEYAVSAIYKALTIAEVKEE